MGHIFTPPLDRLAEHCAYELGLETFVETGTFRGESAGWAAERFVDVITIIMIDDFHKFALPPPEPFRAEHWPSLDEIFALYTQVAATTNLCGKRRDRFGGGT
ncbi:MAG: hypothetical protein NT069_15370, partial [Planctomycetota bacterium]|nr:hypothetical protein [Planctomycetota bacterium]